ncbi:DUF1869 domain-containing protein (plasmid) [Klebsiella pneumoniae]|nr:DUF1869 domain-containing protein [Klebsiella pneumoniae]UTY76839.1 DUF1869 domain-containing protein [Klebsiella pneumoniae]HBV3339689.1 DUF1869 domain-containing protein [Klebsiella pneumoniae]
MKHQNKGYELTISYLSESCDIVKHSLDLPGLYSYDVIKGVNHGLVENVNNELNAMLTITNNSNGISVTRNYQSILVLKDMNLLTKEIKEIANIILGYEEAEENFIHD